MEGDPTQIEQIWQAITELQKRQTPDHFHNGFDFSRIYWNDINQKKFYVEHTIYGADAVTAADYSTFFIAPFAVTVTDFREVHATAGIDVGAVTLDLEKLTGTTAPGSGSSVLAATLSLKATANTVQTATLTATLANRSLAKNDRLALKKSGTLTSVANVTIVTELQVV